MPKQHLHIDPPRQSEGGVANAAQRIQNTDSSSADFLAVVVKIAQAPSDRQWRM
jgi:hypothetical protein